MRHYHGILGANLGAYAHIWIKAETDAEAKEKLIALASTTTFTPEWSDMGDYRIVTLEHEPKHPGAGNRMVVEGEPFDMPED